jgi:hypothetical protein
MNASQTERQSVLQQNQGFTQQAVHLLQIVWEWGRKPAGKLASGLPCPAHPNCSAARQLLIHPSNVLACPFQQGLASTNTNISHLPFASIASPISVAFGAKMTACLSADSIDIFKPSASDGSLLVS